MIYRNPNTSCIMCGGQVPRAVEKERAGDHIEYTCPECGDIIAEGVVSEDGEPANCPRERIPRRVREEVTVSDATVWVCWEAWWTDRLVVAAFHGRAVAGEAALLEFVDKLEEKHDND